MRRRTLAAVGSLLILALWATPAMAMSGTKFTSPSSGQEVKGGSVAIRVETTPDSRLLSQEQVTMEVTLTPPTGAGQPSKITVQHKGNYVYEGSWNAGSAPINGIYKLDAVATSPPTLLAGGAKRDTAATQVRVNIPPAAPTGVKAALKDGVPVVSWTANNEADITGYRVMRNGTQVGQTGAGALSFTDSSAPHSQALTYAVRAVRKSPVADGGIASASSAPTAALTVPAPAAPVEDPAAEGAAAEGAAEGAGAEAVDGDGNVVPGTNIVTGEQPPPPTPASNPNFGKALAPVVRAGPGGTAFDPTLPYEGTPPERFESATGGSPSPLNAQAASDSGMVVTNPVKFIAGGLLLLVASGFMWRASRKLLSGITAEEGFSPNTVNFPAFRIDRG